MKAFVVDIITPIIALIFGKPNFESLTFTINSSHFLYGDFINAVITFVTTAFALFFFVVKPYEAYQSRKDPVGQGLPGVHLRDPCRRQTVPQVHRGTRGLEV